MNEKPIIRHCKNCAYCGSALLYEGYCQVKYKYVSNGRIKALFCRYYKKKGGAE